MFSSFFNSSSDQKAKIRANRVRQQKNATSVADVKQPASKKKTCCVVVRPSKGRKKTAKKREVTGTQPEKVIMNESYEQGDDIGSRQGVEGSWESARDKSHSQANHSKKRRINVSYASEGKICAASGGQELSAEAVSLSNTLKELSSKKDLRRALEVYYDPRYDKSRDAHHGSIMVDCCSRCGAVEVRWLIDLFRFLCV